MKKRQCLMGLVAVTFVILGGTTSPAEQATTPEAGAARAQHEHTGIAVPPSAAAVVSRPESHWFRQAGLGMFIHFGLASAGNVELSWGMMKNTPWDRSQDNRDKLTPSRYFALAKTFDPARYHPESWLRAARNAGFEYAVLTTRHHDGFALWPSQYGDFNTGRYLGGRDLVREYVNACRKLGLKVGFYYSALDWYRNREYQSWNYDSKGTRQSPHLGVNWEVMRSLPAHPAGFEADEAAYINGQLTELLTQYGPIDYLWFDGRSDVAVLSQEQIRRLQPDILINDRQHGFGDVATASYEAQMPERRPAGWWEYSFSMVSDWGYTQPEVYKPATLLIERLAQARSMGGNVLANYAPQADGEMSPLFYEQMTELQELHEQLVAAKAGKPTK
jgi:alpha-L-fucosidase